MLRKAGEVHFSTQGDLVGYVKSTLDVADEAGLAGEDRTALLPAILNLLAAKQVQIEQVNVGGLGLVSRPQG